MCSPVCSCPVSKAFSSERAAQAQIHTRNRAENFCQRLGIPTLNGTKSTRGSLQNPTQHGKERDETKDLDNGVKEASLARATCL